MAQRLVQVFLPSGRTLDFDAIEGDHRLLGVQRDADDQDRLIAELLVPAEQAEALLDHCADAFSDDEGFRALVLSVEAVVPRPDEQDVDAEAGEEKGPSRVSREELYDDISNTLGDQRIFVAMTLLSTVVAAVGLLRDNVAVIVGAMVIAPLLGPNMALCLGATLGDLGLLKRALITNLVGLSCALALAAALGLIFAVDPEIPAIASRTRVDLGDLALGLAAGAAGTLAYTRGLSGAVIGVMVAVALMPPLVALGLLVGDGQLGASLGALTLVAANVVCINLAGVATFLLQGVRPRTWWEEERAKKATAIAIGVWSLLLVALAAIVWWTDPAGR